jgi:hypothetical protein
MRALLWLRQHALVVGLTLSFFAVLTLVFFYRSWIDRHPEIAAVAATLGLLWVTAWYAITTGRILKQNQRLSAETHELAEETRRLAATGGRSLLLQSVPVVAVQHLPTITGGSQEAPGTLVLQNVGHGAAIINRIRLELSGGGGGGQILDSKGFGSELLNLGTGHEYALAASDTVTILLGGRDHSGIVETRPLYSACEVEYVDIAGNVFLARHEPGESFTLSFKGPGNTWQRLDSGFGIDPRTGRIIATPTQVGES